MRRFYQIVDVGRNDAFCDIRENFIGKVVYIDNGPVFSELTKRLCQTVWIYDDIELRNNTVRTRGQSISMYDVVVAPADHIVCDLVKVVDMKDWTMRDNLRRYKDSIVFRALFDNEPGSDFTIDPEGWFTGFLYIVDNGGCPISFYNVGQRITFGMRNVSPAKLQPVNF